MTHSFALAILLGAAVLITIVCSIGVLAMRDAYQRMHYIGPVASIAAICITVAVLLQEGLNQAGLKSLLVTAILMLMNAVLSHATLRAARIRQFGRWEPRAGERVVAEQGPEDRAR